MIWSPNPHHIPVSDSLLCYPEQNRRKVIMSCSVKVRDGEKGMGCQEGSLPLLTCLPPVTGPETMESAAHGLKPLRLGATQQAFLPSS